MDATRAIGHRRLTGSGAIALAGGVVALLLAGTARGQDGAGDVAAARELGIDGVKAADAGDCPTAIDRLSRAEQLRHAPTTLERLGECQVRIGKLVDGTEALRRVVREVMPGAPPAFLAAQERARGVLAEAKPRIARLKIAVAAPANVDFTVKIDGMPLPNANLNVNRPIDPGEHVVEASGPRLLPTKTKVTLPEGGTDSVALTLQLDPNAVPLVAVPVAPSSLTQPAPPQPPPPPPPPSHNRTAAYVTLGIGGAGLVLGTILGAVAIGDKGDLATACGPSKVCNPSEQSTLSSAKTTANLTTAAFIVGGVGVALGGTLFFTNNFQGSGSSGGATNEQRRTVGFVQTYVTATGAGLRGAF